MKHNANTLLVTGGAGFFGSILKRCLLGRGFRVVSIDLEPDEDAHPHLRSVRGDIRDEALMREIFSSEKIHAIFHCAAILAHAVKDKKFLWSSNVDGTKLVAELAAEHGVGKIVFTSTNCLWAENLHRPVLETDMPNPVEIYGKSKWEGEKILLSQQDRIISIIIRCPTIIDSGRLGLLGILFEFIDEGRKVWVVGGGKNRYQFIYAMDLADACLRALDYPKTEIFNIGSDNVKSFREVYQHVIDKAGNRARVAALPRKPTIWAMKIAHALRISPLGPYQYKMIAEDFVFGTEKIKRELGWAPTLTNEEMLYKSYKYYHDNIDAIRRRKNVSAHKQTAEMGIIRLLKWLS
ncbi:UDP-glucose 4-epimerase [Ereboglobus sp. PH5-10]|uniref:NAD-dependent epimerase/dehydratase family protein n=1 Tax=Ereboglobus sp. PH5-10 TaxID=2940629 RepID=UPI0024067439|nr:NAD-dependent epimerase/dehydratase family protein [Ereboglobus sp. PH5-10]MDF9828428.1 UDP-glucose 4-epimerase [Ereboglobus sp. PH5-10]